MNTTHSQQEKGFTIIEVVLVLAIAALIMLMVFMAWPALQRSQRDQARKNDVGLIGSTIASYKTNHKGAIPNQAQLRDIMEKTGMSQYDPSTDLTVKNGPADHDPLDTGTEAEKMVVQNGARCREDMGAEKAGGRQAAILYVVEGNGQPAAQCQDV